MGYKELNFHRLKIATKGHSPDRDAAHRGHVDLWLSQNFHLNLPHYFGVLLNPRRHRTALTHAPVHPAPPAHGAGSPVPPRRPSGRSPPRPASGIIPDPYRPEGFSAADVHLGWTPGGRFLPPVHAFQHMKGSSPFFRPIFHVSAGPKLQGCHFLPATMPGADSPAGEQGGHREGRVPPPPRRYLRSLSPRLSS